MTATLRLTLVLAAGLGLVELLLNSLKGFEHFRQFIGLVHFPILLWGQTNT